MKRWLAAGLAAVLLLTTAQAADMQKQYGLERTKGVLTVTLEDCSSISIRETETPVTTFSGEASLYKTSLGEMAISIEQRDDDDFPPPAVLEIPAGRYTGVRVEAEGSGVTVCPGRADYTLNVRDGACTVQVNSAYTGNISADVRDSALSVSFLGGEPENLRLTAETEDCALDAPKDWGWTWGEDDLSRTWGAGTGRLDLTAKDCAVSFGVDKAGVSRYQDAPGAATMLRTSTGEMAISDPGDSKGGFYAHSDKNGDVWKNLRGASTPNTQTDIKTIPAKGIGGIQVNAHLCGVAVEPSKSGAFELTYVGVKNTKDISVETAVKDGVLSVTCTGTQAERYVNTSPDFRVNTVRLGVPADVLKEIGVDCGTASVLVNGVDVPVRGVGTNGLTRVMGDKRTAAVDLYTHNGAAAVLGGTVSADLTLEARNGSTYLKADTVTGKADLSAKNGSVQVEAGRLDDATLQAKNGSVKAEVETVGTNVFAGVQNGMLTFHLTKQPQDLTFRLSGGWTGKWGMGGLPSGWKDGYTVGSGKPVLELSAASNGVLNFEVG